MHTRPAADWTHASTRLEIRSAWFRLWPRRVQGHHGSHYEALLTLLWPTCTTLGSGTCFNTMMPYSCPPQKKHFQIDSWWGKTKQQTSETRIFFLPQSNTQSQNEGARELKSRKSSLHWRWWGRGSGLGARKVWVTCSSTRGLNIDLVKRDGIWWKCGDVEGIVLSANTRAVRWRSEDIVLFEHN